jgi:hypothetical protein
MIIPGGPTEKEDVQDMLHLLCNATELVLYLFNVVVMKILVDPFCCMLLMTSMIYILLA